jgi:predicted DNA-binding ribbon-helix-helix protein
VRIIEKASKLVKGIALLWQLLLVQWYIPTMMKKHQPLKRTREIERVQTGVRLEKRLLKVLKALAEYMDLSLGELIEVIALSSFEGTSGFSKGTIAKIADLKRIYDLDYGIDKAHVLVFSNKRK